MLKEIKEDLKITWDEEDKKLERIIVRGKSYLENDIAGIKLDFESDETNKSLLSDYCRYSYYNNLEYFEENFQSQLLRLQLKSAVKSFEER